MVHRQRPQDPWPAPAVQDWTATRDALHMWVQIVGKIRMAHLPLVNHWWQAPLYVSPRGLTTSSIPYGTGAFDLEFDFHDHLLVARSSEGPTGRIVLGPKSVADFYTETMDLLAELGVPTAIAARPNEFTLPSRSQRTTRTDPTTPNPCTRSGGNSSRPTASCTRSGHSSSARSVRCTSSGVPWTWRAAGSRAGGHRHTQWSKAIHTN